MGEACAQIVHRTVAAAAGKRPLPLLDLGGVGVAPLLSPPPPHDCCSVPRKSARYLLVEFQPGLDSRLGKVNATVPAVGETRDRQSHRNAVDGVA